MTFTFELDLDSVTLNYHGKYLGQRLFNSKVIVRTYRPTHTGTIALPGLLKWSLMNSTGSTF